MAQRVCGYVLAGGESSRMQAGDLPRDKALIEFEGKTLLERALCIVDEVCGNAAILGGPEERCRRLAPFGRTVADRLPTTGPLGGLDAALADTAGEWLLVVPVDLPLLPASALRSLVRAATDHGRPGVAVMSTPECNQPLPLVLHRSAEPMVRRAMERGEHKLMPVLRDAAEAICPSGLCVVPVADLAEETEVAAWFLNLNTPDDLRNAREHVKSANESPWSASE